LQRGLHDEAGRILAGLDLPRQHGEAGACAVLAVFADPLLSAAETGAMLWNSHSGTALRNTTPRLSRSTTGSPLRAHPLQRIETDLDHGHAEHRRRPPVRR
jgi:hypothetical protein